MIARDRTADSLIIVQSPDALDFYDGVIKEVTTEIVKFDLEGDVIDVKREKLEGFVLFHPNARGSSDRDDAKDPHCIVHDTFGNAWPVTNVAVSSDSLQLTSVDGFVVDLPMSAVRVLDYASPRVLFLSDLEPVRAEVRPFVRSAANDAAYVTWFQPRRDVDFHGEPLSLATAATGKVTLYEKGVAVASQTELIYQLPATYNHLQAVVGMAPYVRPAGNAVLTISADGRTLYQQPVTGEQAAVEIDVALDGAKRLKLLVDYGEDMDVADHIHLCDLKVVK